MIRVSRIAIPFMVACAAAAAPGDETGHGASAPFAFENQGIHFSGNLWLPAGRGPHQAVVMMGGNGPWRPAHWYLDIIRDSLLRRGVAVAYYDRRGEGGSGGDFDRSSFEDLADDAIAAVNAVDGHSGIAATGLFGHSMGGWIAGLAASRSSAVAFVVTAAGPGVGPLEQTLFARANEDRAASLPESTVAGLADLRRRVVEYYVTRTDDAYHAAQEALTDPRTRAWYPRASTWPELQGVRERMPAPAVLQQLDDTNPDLLRWFRRDGRYHHEATLANVTAPYLAIFGVDDPIVPLDASIAALRASVSPQSLLTIRSYDGANHMIMTSSGRTGSSLASGYAAGIADWIVAAAR